MQILFYKQPNPLGPVTRVTRARLDQFEAQMRLLIVHFNPNLHNWTFLYMSILFFTHCGEHQKASQLLTKHVH